MTPLSHDAPLVSLLVIAGKTHDAIARAHKPPVSREAVTMACGKGARIKLSTLAAYTRAAGYTLWVVMQAADAKCRCGEMACGDPHPLRAECNYCAGEWPIDACWCHIGEPVDSRLTYPPATAAENHDATVSQARALVECFGFMMVLAVKPAEGSGHVDL